MNKLDVEKVHFIVVAAADEGQRLDNFIRKRYPSLPKSRIYQMLRKGEVRLNKKRVKPEARLAAGDELRMPPIIDASRELTTVPPFWVERVRQAVIYEDDNFLIVNKPAGIAVHGGSKQQFGVIDAVRAIWGDGYAELAHRLDRDTSGVLVLGKNRAALVGFQAAMQAGEVRKAYWALVSGHWNPQIKEVKIRLEKAMLQGGERMVVKHSEGQWARTSFRVLQKFRSATLLEAILDTGRTHQIRVSVQSKGHGIAGDGKYGDVEFNRRLRQAGFHGMFLHAKEIRFSFEGDEICVQAVLPEPHQQLLTQGVF